jgi:hypothetical protein
VKFNNEQDIIMISKDNKIENFLIYTFHIGGDIKTNVKIENENI